MSGTNWTPAETEQLLRLTNSRSLTWGALCAHFPNRTSEQVRMKARALAKKALRAELPASDVLSDELVADRVLSLEDLLTVTQVDLEVWEVERWVANKWEVGSKIEETIPHPNGNETEWVTSNHVVIKPLFQIKAWFKRKSRLVRTMQELRAGLLEDIRANVDHYTDYTYPRERGNYLFEFSPFDLHLGKLTWAEETVTHYDHKIAEDLFNASLDFLLEKALRLSGGKLDQILCVFGNDAMHVDSKKGETTAGTHMDFDSRYIKIYRRLIHIHRRAIEVLRQHAPVHVSIVPGNHDELTSFHMGEVLSALYEGVEGVTIDNSAGLRKYYEYGVNLFGFTHGDAEKVSELPLLMARERPEMWARCPSREWHIGHKHISEKWESNRRPMLEQDLTSDKGIRVRRLTSLSAHDAWHTKHAYTDRRACEGFLFHKEAGFTDHISFNVDHFTGKALKI